MAVQAQFGGLAGCLLPYGVGVGGGLAEEQLQALLSAAAGNKQAPQQFHCAAGMASAAQSDLTCNGGGGLGGVVASRKRGRDGDLEQYHHLPSSSAALLPIPGAVVVHQKPPAAGNIASSQMADSAPVSTSGRPLSTACTADALLAVELCQQGAEVDALVRAGCERLRAGLERARKRQCEALASAAAAGAERALREKEAELDAARRRAQELEERLRQAAAETQAWCGLARSNEAAASGLRATLDALLLRAGVGGGCGTAHPAAEEGFGESDGTDDAESCCFVDAAEDAMTAPAAKWACRACGGGEASVLLLPCRHLCLCKACEPRTDACPVCSGAKNAAIHIAPN
ncbi:unnamed protein product [Miscanthus lutarioriparius]|uniref:RING-type domain-containing protein n=1 Tax=Miscanthus lutarioriparius TaxID=422564 RepID=A0A811QCL1_9POAL|nr:unnamed protein product [Miscanthus lutarioriparius]